MLEISDNADGVELIDFGRTDKNGKKKILFQLPMLGAKGVPMGITSAFSLFYDKINAGRALTDAEVSSSWNFFIQTLADSYPDATRQLARLDEENLKHVIKYWVSESADYSPKV